MTTEKKIPKKTSWAEQKATEVAAEMLHLIQTDETAYKMMFQSFGQFFHNPCTGAHYRGFNSLWCYFDKTYNNYKSTSYITLNNAKQLAVKQIEGYSVEDIKGKKVVVWQAEKAKAKQKRDPKPMLIEKEDLKNKGIYISYFSRRVTEEINKEGQIEEKVDFIMVSHKIYNVDLFKNITIESLDDTFTFKPSDVTCDKEVIDFCFNNMAVPLRSYTEKKGCKPCYYPDLDWVNMPDKTQYKNLGNYLTHRIHEYAHATAHKSRLNRNLDGRRRGSAKKKELYAFEEVVANLTAVFGINELGLRSTELDKNEAAYIRGWLSNCKDPKAFQKAVNKASNAWLYMTGRTGKK